MTIALNRQLLMIHIHLFLQPHLLKNILLSSIAVSPDEEQSILQSLTIGKAAGPGSISNRLLKELAIPLSEPLCDLFNSPPPPQSGQVPSTWKEANVSPVHKNDDPSVISSYRPISPLNTFGRVMEKIVHKHVFNLRIRICSRGLHCKPTRRYI